MNVNNFPFRFNHSPNILEEGALCNKIKKECFSHTYLYNLPFLLIKLVGPVLLNVYNAYETPRDLIKMQLLMQKAWGVARDPAFLTSSQVRLTVLDHNFSCKDLEYNCIQHFKDKNNLYLCINRYLVATG